MGATDPGNARRAVVLLAALAAGACGKEASDGLASGDAGGSDAATSVPLDLPHFSFFVTSLDAVIRLSGSAAGFGGDLRFGKADGLSGADEICRQIAEGSLSGAGTKPWRAFLSATAGPDGGPVHAIDRVGEGPWYDRRGRLLAMNLDDLRQQRPRGADPAIVDDLPNEDGVPNHAPDGITQVDNHDMLTGSNALGQLYSPDWRWTCQDWTSAEGPAGRPRVGHSWPRDLRGLFSADGGLGSIFGPGGPPFPFDPNAIGDFATFDAMNWISSLDEAGCAPGVGIIEMGPPQLDNPTVGSGGGYGGFYCFSTIP